VSLIYHTIVDNEKCCAAEYTCTKWGTTEIIPQAGTEFFDREEQENNNGNNNSLHKSARNLNNSAICILRNHLVDT
jgi:hypothetical protein